jgi:two-component system KDP operon response regulator KdpE
MDTYSILIIDDEPQIRTLVRLMLQHHGFEVLEATTAADGIKAVVERVPDLILLDVRLPDSSGHDVLKHLREWYSRPIIMMSVNSSSEDITKALDSGANDYIVKPFRPNEVIARIRASIRTSNASRNVPVFKFGNLTIDFVSRTVMKNDLAIKLTSIEYSLLGVLVRNESKVLTHQYLLNHACGNENQNDTQYLRIFVGSLRRKIEDDPNHPKFIVTESGVGYRFVGNTSQL